MLEKPAEQDKGSTGTALNIKSIKGLWSKTYNTEGKPDWSHILPLYDDNIYFRDSIRAIYGITTICGVTFLTISHDSEKPTGGL